MNKVYALTDLHGVYDIWLQVLDILDEDDLLIFLGDAIDRGPSGYRIAKEMLADSRVTYLKGNHEDMFVKSAYYSKLMCEKNGTDMKIHHGRDYSLHVRNGGESTQSAWREDNFNMDVIKQLNNLPYYAYYTNDNGVTFFLCHAGAYEPHEDPHHVDSFDKQIYLWDREHFYDEWPEEGSARVLIHGHTPIPYIPGAPKNIENMKPYVYSNGRKIALDCCTIATGEALLYDLDEMTYTRLKTRT